LVAVGVTTAYLYYRPTAELATTQAPEAVFEEDEIPPTGFETAPETLEAPVVTEAAPGDSPEATAETELTAPADPPTTGSSDNSVQPLEPVPPQTVPEEAVPEAPVPETSAPETSAPEAPVPETAVSEPPQTAPRADPPAELDAELFRDSGAADSSLATSSAEPARAETILAAIAAHLAPYQPTDAAYPLVYHLQIAADGTILALEAISNDAPTLDIPPLSISPGRPLRIELTYTGTAPPRVVELRQP
ncbi:MAG: hypothetical protein AAGI45_11675, partial [Cyanobacteria bacterium P01_H01_bin.26]